MSNKFQLETGQIVYDPRGRVEAEQKPLAPRVVSLTELRLGVLDNTKWNGGKLLRKTVVLLEQEVTFAEVRYYQKESFSKNAAPELIDQIAAESDVVITAIGDWGSCTSCCTHDTVSLEQKGIPTAAIVTRDFLHEAHVQRTALGMAELEPVVITHPLSTLSEAEIESRAREVVSQIKKILTNG